LFPLKKGTKIVKNREEVAESERKNVYAGREIGL
jgi:hypothetical protein